MALVPEDGTGLANADSLCTRAYANAYHATVNQSTNWEASDTDGAKRDAALRVAAIVVSEWVPEWLGCQLTTTQALAWPRVGYDRQGGSLAVSGQAAPTRILQLQCEVAYLQKTGSVFTKGESRNIAEVVVGPLEVVYDLARAASKRYPQLNRLAALFQAPGGLTFLRC